MTLKKDKNFMRSKNIKDAIFFACMVAIPTIHFCIFWFGVNINSILLAFKVYDGETYKWDVFANFARFFNEFQIAEYLGIAVKNSLIASLFTVVLNIALSIIFSLYIYRKYLGSSLFKVILFIPSIVSSIVMVRIYGMICDETIPKIAEVVFGNKEFMGLLANTQTKFGTILFYCLWSGFGSPILIYVGSMNNISESVSEAAQIDGANFVKESWYITLPLIFPTIVTYITVTLTGIFTNELSLYSFYGDAAEYTVQTIGYWFYCGVLNAEGQVAQYPYYSAIGLVFTFICVPVVLAVRGLLNKYGPSVE